MKQIKISEEELVSREEKILANAERFNMGPETIAELRTAIEHARAIRHGEVTAA